MTPAHPAAGTHHHLCTGACAGSGKRALLRFAESAALRSGQRWTAPRAEVYGLLLDRKQPLTAYQLIEALSARLKRDIKPATVYRALEALQGLGLVARIESRNAFAACRHPEVAHTHIFLVCDDCGDTAEVADHDITDRLRQDAASHGFRTHRQILELHGMCRDCQP